MCVAIPGRVVSIGDAAPGILPGVVEFAEQVNTVNLVMVPDVDIDDYVVVHSGFAIRVVPQETATSAIGLLCPEPRSPRS